MYNIMVDIRDPIINLIRHHDDNKCLSIQVRSGQDILILHFDDQQALNSYVGLLQIATATQIPAKEETK